MRELTKNPATKHPGTKHPPQTQRGSTLIELMVGLAIITVLAGLAIPGVMALYRSYHIRSAADDVISAVDFARSQASANRRAYVITLGGLGNTAALKFDVWECPNTNCAAWAGGQKLRSVNYLPNNQHNLPPIQVTRFAPLDLANTDAHVCIKPDGRVLRSDISVPFSPPLGSTMGAGDVTLELQRAEDTGPLGNPVQVQITYNGTARVTFGKPIEDLYGTGAGGKP